MGIEELVSAFEKNMQKHDNKLKEIIDRNEKIIKNMNDFLKKYSTIDKNVICYKCKCMQSRDNPVTYGPTASIGPNFFMCKKCRETDE